MARGIAVLFLLFVSALQPAFARELIPVEHFARLPEATGPSLSPEGDYVAVLVGMHGRHVLMVTNLTPSDGQEPGFAIFDQGEITWVEWVNNERVVFGARFAFRRGGVPTVETRLFTMKRDGSAMKQLLKQWPSGQGVEHQAQFRDDVIDFMPRDGRRILVALDNSNPPFPNVYVVDVEKRRQKLVQRSKIPITDWTADPDGIVRIGVGVNNLSKKIEVIFRPDEKSTWKTISKLPAAGRVSFVPLGFTDRPEVIYVASNHEQDTLALYEFDAVEKKFLKKIFSNDDYDISGLEYSANPADEQVVGVTFRGSSREVVYFSEEAKERRAILDGLFPGSLVDVVSESWNGLRLVVRVSSDTIPPSYYVIDQRDKQPQMLAQAYPELNPETLSPMEPISYEARDGTTIQGYLTLPKGARKENLPLVVMPHGGPTWRVTLGFDYWTQMLASRGYAVFEPNFRGSAGYGTEFRLAGRKEWGGKMQDDITDGVKMLVDKGLADPDHMCIVGASYGGYAALMGAIKTPELFRCAASLNGVTDLIDLINDMRFYINTETNRAFLNDPDKSRSPIHNVGKVRIPVLLAHGEKDRRVPFDHSSRMAKEMKAAGKNVKFLKLPEGDHFLSRGENRLAFLNALDAFLAKHLGPGAEPEKLPHTTDEASLD